uniref:Uncharacterized protein n=1 Tax=Anguilla anguilla TaxID=7936 RepID=A0A0E9RYE9_ANGAN
MFYTLTNLKGQHEHIHTGTASNQNRF